MADGLVIFCLETPETVMDRGFRREAEVGFYS